MKESDFNKVIEETFSQLLLKGNPILLYVDMKTAAVLVANIYYMSNVCSGFGQDVSNAVSVISSPQRISVIADGKSSYYKDDFVICQYENLADDINEILMVLGAAIDRISE